MWLDKENPERDGVWFGTETGLEREDKGRSLGHERAGLGKGSHERALLGMKSREKALLDRESHGDREECGERMEGLLTVAAA